jgi:tetratricopeptide (TPR) repeat protein
MARLLNFQTPIFGIGLAYYRPYWIIGHKWGTEFRLHACLLGSYVAIPEFSDHPDSFAEYPELAQKRSEFPVWKKMLVTVAGVSGNILCSYAVLMILIAAIGQPQRSILVYSLSKETTIALRAGLKCQDQILSVNGTDFDNPSELATYQAKHPNTLMEYKIVRSGNPLAISMVSNTKGKVGISIYPGSSTSYKHISNPLRSIHLASKLLLSYVQNFYGGLIQLFYRPAGVISEAFRALFELSKQSLYGNWALSLVLFSQISVYWALINLIPYPGISGGNLLWYVFYLLKASYNWLKRAAAKCKVQDYQGTIDDYDSAIKLDNTPSYSFKSRAESKAAINDYAGAGSDYDEAIRLDPNDASIYVARSKNNSSRERYSEAMEDANHAIDLDQYNVEAFIQKGNIKRLIEDDLGAIDEYTEAIRLSQPHFQQKSLGEIMNTCSYAYFYRGDAHLLSGDINAAMKDYTTAKELNHDLFGMVSDRYSTIAQSVLSEQS